MGLNREAVEIGRARVSFPPPLSRCLTYWNLFLSAKNILHEQGIAQSGQSKVSVVTVNKANIIYYCCMRAERSGKESLSSSTSPRMCLWLRWYLFPILLVQSFIKVCGKVSLLCLFVLFWWRWRVAQGMSQVEFIQELSIFTPRRRKKVKLSLRYFEINNTDVQTLKERILLVYFTLLKYF